MSVTYQINPMCLADYDEVIALWRDCEGVGLNESDTREAIGAYLVRNPNLSFVARHEAKVVGAVLCGHDGRRGYLHHLAVAREHRRRGIGRALLERCLRELEKINVLKCNIFVFADNLDGQLFWQRNQWVKRHDLLVMQKPTTSPPR